MRRSLVIFGIFAVVVAVFYFVYFPALSKYHNLKQEEDNLRREITELDRRIEALIEERHLLQNDLNYLEKVIREELGLVKPGEVVYKMITEEIPAMARPKNESSTVSEDTTQPQPEAAVEGEVSRISPEEIPHPVY